MADTRTDFGEGQQGRSQIKALRDELKCTVAESDAPIWGRRDCKLPEDVEHIRAYPKGARLFTSAVLQHGQTSKADLVSACGGNASFCSMRDCKSYSCVTKGADMGSPRLRGAVEFASTGDVLAYPIDFRTR